MKRWTSSIFVVAVAILTVMSHICAGPLHAHAGAVTTHSEDHGDSNSDGTVHGGSCEALRTSPTFDLPALPVGYLAIVPITAILPAIARPLPAPNTSPPLFLLYAVLLI
jgi:hypothetical protein